ncbi:hypothetical protein [Roseisolibacter agri]|uniref:Uncharacterized protein n=1 Tax=Roseisolibacter agri TaxID=2014610 RepID=A0AA37VAU1_9BACT|nr:hypothetical protein [Roseisolibacter agri]GLC25783.1 hypothetical protein rosag_22960 [Roseisolibacter agri]
MTTIPRHVLEQLSIPTRYEKLIERVGSDVVKLLTPPDGNIEAFRKVAVAAAQTGEGLLVPCYGETGTGKTTLAESLSFFLPGLFTPTATHQGLITYDALSAVVDRLRRETPPLKGQLIPLNIDHREGAPPTDEELASIKRFLRTSQVPCVVLWLETDLRRAQEVAERYTSITGRAIIDLPLTVTGPARETWHDIAGNTIELCNPLPEKQVGELGIEPRDYDVSRFPSIGEFMKRIAIDFSNQIIEHQSATKKPVTLVLAYVSESLDRGVLPSFTHGGEPGLLDSHALLKCTPESMIGKRWSAKRGVLTQTIFRLDARAFWFPPAAAVSILRRYGPQEVSALLERIGRSNPSPTDVSNYLSRSDLGRFLLGDTGTAYETRGRPAEEAKAALAKVGSEYGFGSGNDKKMNAAFLEALLALLESQDHRVRASAAEQALDFCGGIIPDNQIDLGDRIVCIEYIWRSGEALDTSRRSEAAQYALQKLHNYAVNLGWTAA